MTELEKMIDICKRHNIKDNIFEVYKLLIHFGIK